MADKVDTTRTEIAEDARRVGVALCITGLIGTLVSQRIGASLVVVTAGVILCGAGYILSAIVRRS